MSDLQQILQDLSNLLPAVPEKLTSVRQAGEELERTAQDLRREIQEKEAQAEALVERLGLHLVAISDASTEEHAQYEKTVEAVLMPLAMALGGIYSAGSGPNSIVLDEIALLKTAPVAARMVAEALAQALDELRAHLGELEKRLAEDGKMTTSERDEAEEALEEASQALTEASEQVAAAVEEQRGLLEASAEEFEQGLDTVLSTCQERLSARVQAFEETVGQDLKGRIEGTTEEVRQDLTDVLSGLGDALEELKAKLEVHGDAVARGHALIDPLLNKVQGFLDPLRHGIDSVREGARRLGLPG